MTDTKLSGLGQGTIPALVYGEEGGVSKKYNDLRIFNVLNYGAFNDNTNATTTTAAIQSAYNAAASLSPPGGIIYFPPGTYAISQPIHVDQQGSYVFSGAGKGATSLNGTIDGFIISQVGQIPQGGAAVSIIGAAGSTGGGTTGLIRLHVSGTGTGGTTATNPTQQLIAPNCPYTITGISGAGNVAALNGVTTTRFLIVDSTHLDVIGSSWPGSTYTSGGDIAGGTQIDAVCVEKMHINNPNAAVNCGCIYYYWISKMGVISDCFLEGFICADVASNRYIGGNFGVAVYDTGFVGCGTVGDADGFNTGYAGMAPNSVGLYLGEGCAVNCRLQTFDIGICLSGNAASAYSCSVERSNIGIYLGSSAGSIRSDNVSGCVVSGCQTEAVQYGIYVGNTSGAQVTGNVITASRGTPNFATVNNMHWSGGTVTVTTAHAHNLTAPVGVGFNGISAGAYTTGVTDTLGNLVVNAVTGSTTFTFLQPNLSSDPGFASASWDLAPVSCIYVAAANCLSICNNNMTNFSSVTNASIDLSTCTMSSHNIIMASDIPSGMKLPPATQKAAWKLISSGNFNGPSFSMSFADLPGQSGVSQPGPYEGQEYDIVNATVPTFLDQGGTAHPLVGGTVTTGGAVHAKVRYNGTNWTFMGG